MRLFKSQGSWVGVCSSLRLEGLKLEGLKAAVREITSLGSTDASENMVVAYFVGYSTLMPTYVNYLSLNNPSPKLT